MLSCEIGCVPADVNIHYHQRWCQNAGFRLLRSHPQHSIQGACWLCKKTDGILLFGTGLATTSDKLCVHVPFCFAAQAVVHSQHQRTDTALTVCRRCRSRTSKSAITQQHHFEFPCGQAKKQRVGISIAYELMQGYLSQHILSL